MDLEYFPVELDATTKIYCTFIFNVYEFFSRFSLFFLSFSFHLIRFGFLEEICHGKISLMVFFSLQSPPDPP